MKIEKEKEIKCVVWDLDETLWQGILLESDDVELKPGVREVIQTLDSRGIIHSVASRNNYDDAMEKIREFRLHEYFLYPEIGWGRKSLAIEKIQKNLNIATDTMMLVDDQPFERDEVKHVHPEITCVDATEYIRLPSHPRLNPEFITRESGRRRLMYSENKQRKKEEEEFKGPKRDFLAGLNIQFRVSRAKETDLKRAEELAVRTNQLNTTGRVYEYDELKRIICSDRHELLICEMEDKYGSHGQVGLALIEMTAEHFHIKLLLMSCRVMHYGVGTVLLTHILERAKEAGRGVRVDFRKTGRNRVMYITLKFANFMEVESETLDSVILENDLSVMQEYPPYIDVIVKRSRG